jgi:uncharacterized protein (DUF488 family)
MSEAGPSRAARSIQAMSETTDVWTVGHSNHEFEAFAALLAAQEIEFIVDVRSYPYSRFAPQFNREDLQPALAHAGLRYVFMGEELGGRPSHGEHYDAEGHARYDLMADEPGFQQAVDRLVQAASKHRLALMCSEADPHDCHRRLLVGKILTERGVSLRHILTDGTVLTEGRVRLGGELAQRSLFEENEQPWRSTRSVSHRRRLSTSSSG